MIIRTRIFIPTGWVETDDPIYKTSFHGVEVFKVTNPRSTAGNVMEHNYHLIPTNQVLSIIVAEIESESTAPSKVLLT